MRKFETAKHIGNTAMAWVGAGLLCYLIIMGVIGTGNLMDKIECQKSIPSNERCVWLPENEQ